jgi:aspartate racemase
VADLLVHSVEKLAAAGADFVISPDNTVHQALPLAEPRSALPWLHIASAVTDAATQLGARRVGVLGTRFLMEGPVYPEKLEKAGIEWRIPGPAEREALHRIIFDELCYGRVTSAARARAAAMVDALREREGCDAVVLGCTELPLLVTPEVSSLPTLDSTRLLARAAIARAADAAG